MLTYYFKIDKLSQPLNQYALLEEMLALRALGYSYTVLADKYKVPKTTIRYLVRKFGLAGKETTVVIRQRATRVKIIPLYTEEIINPGKTYAEYVAEEKARKLKHA